MPAVRILDNVQLDANAYVIKVKEVEAGTGKIWPGPVHGHGPDRRPGESARRAHTEPTFGLPATWVDAAQKEEAAVNGYTVVDAATVLSTHLTEMIKANMAELLSYAEVQKLLKELPKEQGELVKDIVPAQITMSGIQRVLQLLLAERVSIRDLGDHPRRHRRGARLHAQPGDIAEHVRARLSRQICAQYTSPAGYLPLIALSAKWEQAFAEFHRRPGRRPQPCHAALAAVRIHHAGARALRGRRARGRGAGARHLRLGIRPFVRAIIERFRRRRRCSRRPKSTPAPG